MYLQAYRLATAEQAQAEYQRNKKKEALPAGAAFNNRTLYKAYEKRAAEIPYTLVCLAAFLAPYHWWHPLISASVCWVGRRSARRFMPSYSDLGRSRISSRVCCWILQLEAATWRCTCNRSHAGTAERTRPQPVQQKHAAGKAADGGAMQQCMS